MDSKQLIEVLVSGMPAKKLKDNEEELFSLIPQLRLCEGFEQNNECRRFYEKRE